MRPYALIALLAATVYADGHAEGELGEEQKDEMNAAETLVKAIDDITELFVEESNLIEDGKISP